METWIRKSFQNNFPKGTPITYRIESEFIDGRNISGGIMGRIIAGEEPTSGESESEEDFSM